MARATEVTITERDLLGRRPLVPRFLAHVQRGRCGNSCEIWISPFDSRASRTLGFSGGVGGMGAACIARAISISDNA